LEGEKVVENAKKIGGRRGTLESFVSGLKAEPKIFLIGIRRSIS